MGTQADFGKGINLGLTLSRRIDQTPKFPCREFISAMHCLAGLKIMAVRWCQRCTMPLFTFSRNAQTIFINFAKRQVVYWFLDGRIQMLLMQSLKQVDPIGEYAQWSVSSLNTPMMCVRILLASKFLHYGKNAGTALIKRYKTSRTPKWKWMGQVVGWSAWRN